MSLPFNLVKFLLTLFLISLLLAVHTTFDKANIKILYTAALINNQYEMRKEEYIKGLQSLHKFGFCPYIVESCALNKTFFDDYCCTIFYTQSNNLKLRNKGVNEAKSMLIGLSHSCFDDSDMILKITGRYWFVSDFFIRTILQNYQGYDAIVKYDPYGQVVGACYAIRCRYLREMLQNTDYDLMEKHMINIERVIANYLQKNKHRIRIMSVEKLDLFANCFGDGKTYAKIL